MMNDADMTEAEWNALTPRERREIIEDARERYLEEECSPEQRARLEWENS